MDRMPTVEDGTATAWTSVMLALAIVMPLLVASATDCYLVTGDGITRIPCDFRAATTDALRYAARDAPDARARRAEQQKRDANLRPWAQMAPFVPGVPRARGTR
jgi:hypothetical protein